MISGPISYQSYPLFIPFPPTPLQFFYRYNNDIESATTNNNNEFRFLIINKNIYFLSLGGRIRNRRRDRVGDGEW